MENKLFDGLELVEYCSTSILSFEVRQPNLVSVYIYLFIWQEVIAEIFKVQGNSSGRDFSRDSLPGISSPVNG